MDQHEVDPGPAAPGDAPPAPQDRAPLRLSLPRRLTLKARQSLAFVRDTRTPLPLIRDTFKLGGGPYDAVHRDGTRMRLHPGRGEFFVFFENVVRRDYLANGLTLRAGDVVLDVGANLGSFTVVAARLVGPTGLVCAFEPNPRTFDRLQESVRLNGLENVRCFPFAVGGHPGSFEFFAHEKSLFGSLKPGIDGRGAEDSIVTTVPVKTLAEVVSELGLDRIDLLKLDCEGSEYDIFDTLTPEVAGLVRQLAMETHTVSGRSRSELFDRLDRFGFSVIRPGLPGQSSPASGRPAVIDPHPSRPSAIEDDPSPSS